MTIKRFKSFIKEAYLDDYQRSGFTDYAASRGFKIDLDKPSMQAKKISGKVMPDTIELPMMNSTMQAVHNHLLDNGYSEVDYANKVVHKDTINNRGEKQRQTTNIGKALTQTKADQTLINSFNNDNHKEAADLASKYKVVISRIPHDIAACSTNAPWSSCAKLTSSGYPSVSTDSGWGDQNEWDDDYVPPHKVNPTYAAAKLPEEILHGTHVAYMVPNMDHPENKRKYFNHISSTPTHSELIDNAVGRILLKPFRSSIADHTILRPESKGYIKGHKQGIQVPQGFKDTVANFAETNFPAQENIIYKKHPDLYNDDHKPIHINLDITKPFKDWDYLNDDVKTETLKHSNISSNDITNYLSKIANNESVENPELLDHLHHARNFTKKHLDAYYSPQILDKTTDSNLHNKLIESANKDQFEKIFDHVIHKSDDRYSGFSNIINNKHFNEAHVNKALNSSLLYTNSHFADNILSSNLLKGETLTNVINKSFSYPTFGAVIHNSNITSEHMTNILQHPKSYPNFGSSGRITTMLANNIEKIKPDHIDQIIHNYKQNSNEDNFESLAGVINSNAILPRHLHEIYKMPLTNGHSRFNTEFLEKSILRKTSKPNALELNDTIVDNMIKQGREKNVEHVIPYHQLAKKHLDDLVLNPYRLHNISNHLPDILDQDNLTNEHFKSIFNPEHYNQYPEETRHSLHFKLLKNPTYFDKFINNIPSYSSQYHSLLNTGRSYSDLMGTSENALKFFRPDVINKLGPADKAYILQKIHTAKTNIKDVENSGDPKLKDQIEQFHNAYKNIQGML